MRNFSSLLNITLHVSDGLSVHHQEFKTVHTTSGVCMCVCVYIYIYIYIYMKHAVSQLVEALRYKSEGRGFDSRWCLWNFSLT